MLLLGDPAYPFTHPECNITREQLTFSYCVSRARVVVERAFDVLKHRWRVLKHEQEATVANVCTVICACCTLHTYCNAHIGDMTFDDENEAATLRTSAGRSQDRSHATT